MAASSANADPKLKDGNERKGKYNVEASRWYKPDIGPRLKPPIRKLFETWSGLAGDDLIAHLHQVRDKAWQHGQYPCVGEWMFLLPFIPNFSQYPRILALAQAGATVLDLGCCFGQDLRLLAADGAPPQNMYACDIKEELWQLGFELFRDREKMHAKFVQADIFDPDSDLVHLSGQMDIIIASQFLHLWDWKRQMLAMKKIVELSRSGSILVGYQRGQVRAQEVLRPWGKMFFHDLETYKEIWHQVEVETGSLWEVEAEFVDLRELGMEEEDLEWMPPGQKGINFVVTRQS